MHSASRTTTGSDTDVASLITSFETALRSDDRRSLVENGRQLIARRPTLDHRWGQLGTIMAVNGEVTLARQAFEILLASCPGDPAAILAQVDMLAHIGAWIEVMELLRSWPANLSKPASYAYSRGTAALCLGDEDGARRFLEEAVRRYPHVGTPWLGLNLVANYSRDSVLGDFVIGSQALMDRAPAIARGAYYYALGKVHADRSEHAKAFHAYSEGARLTRALVSYRRELDRNSAEQAVSGFTTENIAKLAAAQTEATDKGIFVLGLPRSGTTLVEQILTSHSAVSDGGEIYRLILLAKDAGGSSMDAVTNFMGRFGAPEAANLWRHWLDERFPNSGRVVVKTLTNSRHLGLAASLLPQAPLIWLTRDPLDCAWSCFRTRFGSDATWSYDLEEMAYHFRLERELLSRWTDILGDKVLIVPLEGLISQPETWIRKLLAHCGLPEEPQVFEPQKNVRVVSTTSAMQVRQAINRNGIGIAEPYRKMLAPFETAFSA